MSDENNDCEEGAVSLNNLVEQIDEEVKMVEDANALLGGSDCDRCTFSDGYVDRQALYSCITCRKVKIAKANSSVKNVKKENDHFGNNEEHEKTGNDVSGVRVEAKEKDDDFLAGVCLACSMHCHEGHELIELYTKRNFRCDCGNSKFPEAIKCKLLSDRPFLNDLNHYNHNFEGLYCNCNRPYPDPDLENEEDMIQCILCEDWHHAKHLSASLSVDSSDYDELVCSRCMYQNAFLWNYVPLCKAICEEGMFLEEKHEEEKEKKDLNGDVKGKKREGIGSKKDVDVETVYSNDSLKDCPLKKLSSDFPFLVFTVSPTTTSSTDSSNTTTKTSTNLPTTTTATSTDLLTTTTTTEYPSTSTISTSSKDSVTTTTSSIEFSTASYTKLSNTTLLASPVYWPKKWRGVLCRCSNCLNLYSSKGLSFLVKSGDSLWEYEEAGKKKSGVVEDPLAKLNHAQKLELIEGYTDLKVNLSNFLRKFAENGKVVRQEDIGEFFEMQSRKRKKVASGNQYFCK